MNLRIRAVLAILAGFPAVLSAWYLALRSGLKRMATMAGMYGALRRRCRPPFDEGAAFPLSGPACHGCKTGAACHLFSVGRACFRAFDQNCGGTDRSETGNGADDFEGAGLRFFGADAGPDFKVDVAQLSFDQRHAGAALLDRKGDPLGLDAVQKAGLVPEQSLARDLQFFEFAQSFRHWCLWRPSPVPLPSAPASVPRVIEGVKFTDRVAKSDPAKTNAA